MSLTIFLRGISAVVATHVHNVGDIIFHENHASLKAVNHSCKANAALHSGSLVAIEKIPIGEEITLNAIDSNASLDSFCMECGAHIQGYRTACMRKVQV